MAGPARIRDGADKSETITILVVAAVVLCSITVAAQNKVRIIQTNSAGDNVHIIDPATNKVVGEIGIEAGHGAGASPDGRTIYVSNEAESTLDIVDARTLKVTTQVPLTGHPNNMAVGKDGRYVYVGIIRRGGVDVIETATRQRIKNVPTKGTIHNVYVTPDGKYAVAGSIGGKTINVIDAHTNADRVDDGHGSGRAADDVQHESRRLDQVDLRATERLQRVCRRRLRDAEGNPPHPESGFATRKGHCAARV